MNIGRAIRLCRSQRRLTQSELSARSGLSVSFLSMIEKGQRDPALSSLEATAKGLEVPLNILMFLAAEKDELVGMSDELKEKLSKATLELLKEPTSGYLL